MKEFLFRLKDKTEIELFIAILSLGILCSIQKGILSIEWAEVILFSPFSMSTLKRFKVSKELMDLLHRGTELSSVRRIVPEHYNQMIEELISEASGIIKMNSHTPFPDEKWMDKL